MRLLNLILCVLLGVSLVFIGTGCGTNVYSILTSKKSEDYSLKQAKILIDKAEYAKAEEFLEQVEENSNEKLVLTVAAKLGKSGMSVWKIVTDMIDNKTFSEATGGGFDRIYDLFSEAIYGAGETRTKRLSSISDSVALLESSTNKTSSIQNLSCFFSGLLVAPRVKDGTTAIADATLALNKIMTSVTGGGITKDNCPDLDQFTTPLNNISGVQSDISLALDKISNCSFLNYQQTGKQNEVQKNLSKFITNADKGCADAACNGNAACEALKLTCVKDLLVSAATAKSGDGKVDVCEILVNCRTLGSCF